MSRQEGSTEVVYIKPNPFLLAVSVHGEMVEVPVSSKDEGIYSDFPVKAVYDKMSGECSVWISRGLCEINTLFLRSNPFGGGDAEIIIPHPDFWKGPHLLGKPESGLPWNIFIQGEMYDKPFFASVTYVHPYSHN